MSALLDSENTIKSLCPVLGEVQLKLQLGACPLIHKKPYKKELAVCHEAYSFPFIKKEPHEGSSFRLLEIFAEKFGFSSNFKVVPEDEIEVLIKMVGDNFKMKADYIKLNPFVCLSSLTQNSVS